LIKWGSRPICSLETLAVEGYCLLGERLRSEEEREFIRLAIEKHCKTKLNLQLHHELYFRQSILEKESLGQFPSYL